MRRSKEDSLKTRRSVVLAARRVFARRGVTNTSMEHIAQAAGVTRGAIYGHFRNKEALFQCMREQVRLPLVDVMNESLLHSPQDPLAGAERYLAAVLDAMATDAATRETFLIMLFKCEYVGEIAVDMKRQAGLIADLAKMLEVAYRRAGRLGHLRKGIVARTAAVASCAFLVGMVRLWLLDEEARLVRGEVARLVRAHMATLRA